MSEHAAWVDHPCIVTMYEQRIHGKCCMVHCCEFFPDYITKAKVLPEPQGPIGQW